ncbi:MAG: two-component system response regulator [Gammaproteobacteria bacterium]|nr:two-component system response regulator [Gammaproteobacteria bacterium]HJP18975.1 response regulator [Nitrospinota bacterium]|tara:strand:+ start:1249 stop:2349 length:1101 start_codon:yes stop_codon:yes gene_type:complete
MLLNEGTPNLLIVDDEENNIYLLESLLVSSNFKCINATNGEDAIKIVRSKPDKFDLILLDINMPGINGLEVAKTLKSDEATKHVAIIFLTASVLEEDNLGKGLETGAEDYLHKPFNYVELLARIKAVLRTKRLQDELRELNNTLAQKVKERTTQIEKTQDVAIFGLAKLAEYRDPETGLHLERIRTYTKVLAKKLKKLEKYNGLINKKYIEMIYKSSPLHDIGKVGISDKILLKPGKLTDDEFDIMKTHAKIGGDAIAAAEKDLKDEHTFLTMGKIIAYYHHEKFDGSGYPNGLKGEAIPLAARICALCDVFDALISKRPYKKAWKVDDALALIKKERGKHFDPTLVDVFKSSFNDILAIKEKYDE